MLCECELAASSGILRGQSLESGVELTEKIGGRLWMSALLLVCALPRLAVAQNTPTSATSTQAASAHPRNLNVDDYFRIKDVEDARISPDGKWVAYVITTHDVKEDKNKTQIWMTAAVGGEAIPLTPQSANSTHPRWSPDGKYLGFLSEHGSEKKQVWLLPRGGGEAEQLTNTIQDVSGFEWSPAGDRMVLLFQDPSPEDFEAVKKKAQGKADEEEKKKTRTRPFVIDRLHFKEDEIGYLDRRRTHLYVVSLNERKPVQITFGDYDDSEPAWSPDGKQIAFTSNRTAEPDSNFNSDIWIVAADGKDPGKTPRQLTTNPAEDSTPAWSPDGKSIAYITQEDPKLFWYATYHLAVVDASGGKPRILTKSLDRTVTAPRFSPDGAWIYFIAEDEGMQNLLRVSPKGGEIGRPIAGRRKVESYSISGGGVVAAAITSSYLPDEVFALPATGDLRRLTKVNDETMSGIELGSVEYVHYKSKDGTALGAYIVKPPDYKAGVRYPTILWLHGGPVLSHQAEFDFRAQIFAANGYVVVQPNPRGSAGYGESFSKAIFADWGHKDYEDDMAAVDYALAQGFADPERLAVGGHSYGAISTDFIITQTHRFKAAIANAGEFLYIVNYGTDLYSRHWEYELGLPWENRALWEKLSSFSRIKEVTTPTLIIGGDADFNVPIVNSEQIYQSLRRLGVPTLLVVYPGEYHDFVRPSFVKDLHERYLFWFAHYVKGEGPASPPEAKGAE
jgi:dipeptidyl aminopeptidase/acylaminoacyl peptidase